jgi:uncharacterized protein (TIGR03382 family)
LQESHQNPDPADSYGKEADRIPGLARSNGPVILAPQFHPDMLRFLFFSLGLSGAAAAVTYSTNATVTAPPPTLTYTYREEPGNPGNLILDNTYPVTDALQGTAGAAGGNVELFATGDQDPQFANPASGQPFATVPLVSLAGSANNAEFTLTSLNGNTWFTTTGGGTYDVAWGANNLANVWFNQLADAVVAEITNALVIGLINANRQSIYEAFRDQGGFTELSDPNISHLYEDAGTFNIGLAGFLDQSPRLRVLFPDFAAFIPDGIQWSEVVMVNGVPRYSFTGVPSGVSLDDNFGSFNATYVITAPAAQIPEPASAALAVLAGAALGRRRR